MQPDRHLTMPVEIHPQNLVEPVVSHRSRRPSPVVVYIGGGPGNRTPLNILLARQANTPCIPVPHKTQPATYHIVHPICCGGCVRISFSGTSCRASLAARRSRGTPPRVGFEPTFPGYLEGKVGIEPTNRTFTVFRRTFWLQSPYLLSIFWTIFGVNSDLG